MITSNQIQIIRQIFLRNKLNADLIANVFFNYLFSLRPILWLLLYEKMGTYKNRFVMIVQETVQGSSHLDFGNPVLATIGCEHALDGIQREDYELAKTAFLFTLEQFLDNEFTPEVKKASAAVFEAITYEMICAANKLGEVLSLDDSGPFNQERKFLTGKTKRKPKYKRAIH